MSAPVRARHLAATPRLRRAVDRTAAEAGGASLGSLSVLSVVVGGSLVVMALAYTLARVGFPNAEMLYWVALAGLFGPVFMRLLGADASRRERIGLTVTLGLGMFMMRVLRQPMDFRGHDELQHLRTYFDIEQSGQLFLPNPLLTVSPAYPGLEIATHAVSTLTGLDVFGAGNIVLAFGRVILVLSLFLIFERVSRSSRAAGIGTAIYMTNTSFVFFSASFAYESLALAFMALLLYAVLRLGRAGWGIAWARSLTGLALLALVVTHHLTGIVTVAFLAMWTVVHWAVERRRPRGPNPALVTVVAAATVLGWMAVVTPDTISYLGEPVRASATDFVRFVTGEGAGRELFAAPTGEAPPLWERALALSSVALVSLLIPFGLWQIWRRHRRSSAAVVLGLLAAAYPVSLAVRFTPGGAEAAGRAVAFLFLGVGFTVGLAIARNRWRNRRAFKLGVTAATCAVLFGSVIVATAPWSRLPTNYIVGADSASIDEQGLAAAHWSQEILGPGHRMATDRVNRLLMGAYGGQRIVYPHSDGVQTWEVFFSEQLGPEEAQILNVAGIEYVAIDDRLLLGLPLVGFYFELGEVYAGPHTEVIDSWALRKFDHQAQISRVYDNGAIRVYDVRQFEGAE